MSQPTHFQVIPDFNAQSANGATCYISHLPKQSRRTPQQQEHELDEFVLRGPEIEFEGYLDIRPAVIMETAQWLGMVSKEAAEVLREALKQAEESRIAALARAEAAESRLTDMILVNAEQIVQEQALADELAAAYEDLYDHTDDHVSFEDVIREEGGR